MTKIAVVVAIPSMIVFQAAMRTVPITREELLAVVTRPDPVGSFIRRTRPIAGVPAIPAVNRVLITVYPQVAGSRRCGTNRNHAWRRRRADANANADLSAQSERASDQEQS